MNTAVSSMYVVLDHNSIYPPL